MEYRVLGPLEIRDGVDSVEVGAGKLRVVLALLLLRVNRNVSIDEFADALWDGAPPRDARAVVQKYLMRVRRVITGDSIRTEPEGYRMTLADDQLDLTLFNRLVADADRANEVADDAKESEALGHALELWSSRAPLLNVPSTSLIRTEVPKLTEVYVSTLERRIELDLRGGRHREVVGELTALVAEHPMRESLWAQMMRALHASGRTDEALDAYRRLTSRLADDLGVGPGRTVRDAYESILRRNTASGGVSRGATLTGTPRQLPIAVSGFVGRKAQEAEIVTALRNEAQGVAPPVVLMTGPAGIGKTTLAVRVAHGLADEFPDGQLYCDCRAYAPSVALSVEEVCGRFLHALGMPTEKVPASRSELVATYRSLLAAQRTLVVLDNVDGEDQVRALLPSSPESAVVVTSRHELTGLTVDPGAHRIALDVLSQDESRQLLDQIVGERRVGAEPAAVADLTTLCGGLALALRVAAAHLVMRPSLSVADYARQLRRLGPVSELRVTGDERADLAGALGWSYSQLDGRQRRMVRMMGVTANPDISVRAAGAVLDVDENTTRSQLDRLVEANLLTCDGRRYGFHDLIRQYMLHQSRREDTDVERLRARERLLDYYILKTDRAVQPVLALSRLAVKSVDPPQTLEDSPSLESVDADRAAMVAAVRTAATQGPYEKAYHLADALRGYFALRGHAVDWRTVVAAGLSAARRDGDREGMAAMLNSRGALRYLASDVGRARRDLSRAVDLYEALGSPGANAVRMNLGLIAHVSGDLAESVAQQEAAIIGYREAGEPDLEARARENLVFALLEAGDLDRATAESASLADPAGPSTVPSRGVTPDLARYTGDLRVAIDLLSAAADLAAARGDQANQVGLLDELANAHIDVGDIEEAQRTVDMNIVGVPQVDPATPYVQATLARVYYGRGDAGRARRQYTYALQLATEMHNLGVECDVLTCLARLDLEDGNVEGALSRAGRAETTADRTGRRLRQIQANTVLSACHLAEGDVARARKAAQQALEASRTCGYPLGTAAAWECVGATEKVDGDVAATRQAWEQAESIYRSVGAARAADVLEKIAELDDPAIPTA